ncbi:hypothetical protein GN956_G7804 [Arapaima gigas]
MFSWEGVRSQQMASRSWQSRRRCLQVWVDRQRTVDGDARGGVGGVQVFAQQRALWQPQDLPLGLQLLPNDEDVAVIQVERGKCETLVEVRITARLHAGPHRQGTFASISPQLICNLCTPPPSTTMVWIDAVGALDHGGAECCRMEPLGIRDIRSLRHGVAPLPMPRLGERSRLAILLTREAIGQLDPLPWDMVQLGYRRKGRRERGGLHHTTHTHDAVHPFFCRRSETSDSLAYISSWTHQHLQDVCEVLL